jgi:Na+/H+-dicarboxylate symporter
MHAWTKIILWKRVIGGLLLGLIVGLGLRYGLGAEFSEPFGNTWLKPFGDAFVNLVKMLVVPLVFTTLVSGITAMGDPAKLGGLGAKTIALYLATTVFAVTLGLIFGSIFQPGNGISLTPSDADVETIQRNLEAGKAASGGIADKLLAIIPTNPVAALAATDILAIIFFAIILGIGILLSGDTGTPVKTFFESASDVMLKVTVMIMELAPIGVFFLIAWVMATKGLSVLGNLSLLTVALYLACLVQIVFVYGFGLIRGVLRLPVMRFFEGIRDAQVFAYSTSTSSGTLPITIRNVSENLGVKKSVAASVLPVGATINMDGTAIYLGLIALFAAQASGVSVAPGDYVLIALTATLASIGTAGIPSASLFLATTVMSVMSAPDGSPLLSDAEMVAVIALIFPFDRLLDMMRTLTNVTGDAAVASVVAKWEGELDEEVFRRKATI